MVTREDHQDQVKQPNNQRIWPNYVVGQQHQQHLSCHRRRGRRRRWINKFEEQPKSDRWAINPFWLVNSSAQMHGQLVDTYSLSTGRQDSPPVDWLSRSPSFLSHPVSQQPSIQRANGHQQRRTTTDGEETNKSQTLSCCLCGIICGWGWAAAVWEDDGFLFGRKRQQIHYTQS